MTDTTETNTPVGESQEARQAGLAPEPLQVGSVAGQMGVHHLQGHHLAGGGVPRPENGGLAARRDLFQDLVSTYSSLMFHSRTPLWPRLSNKLWNSPMGRPFPSSIATPADVILNLGL